MTKIVFRAMINYVAEQVTENEYVERYRSGHNEAVLKTVCPRGRVGSNPTLSAKKRVLETELFLHYQFLLECSENSVKFCCAMRVFILY